MAQHGCTILLIAVSTLSSAFAVATPDGDCDDVMRVAFDHESWLDTDRTTSKQHLRLLQLTAARAPAATSGILASVAPSAQLSQPTTLLPATTTPTRVATPVSEMTSSTTSSTQTTSTSSIPQGPAASTPSKHDDRNFDQSCNHYTDDQKRYCPRYMTLASPSRAPLFTFYVYRAQSDEKYGPQNTNVASLGGVLWYLQNEVVPYCSASKGSVDGNRKFKITRILRYKITMRPTERLRAAGLNFGSRVAFDLGKNTGGFKGPGTEQQAYETYGYVVGCNKLGDGPFPRCPSKQGSAEGFCPILYGEDAVWYSLPGRCPSKDVWSKSPLCGIQQPGGYCQGIPTGAGNCTWTFEDAGEINIDELVGIKSKFQSRREFCEQDCMEYDKFRTDKGRCGISFWDGRTDEKKNLQRIHALDGAFKQKYPDMPAGRDLPAPACDFDQTKFYDFPNPWNW